MLFYPVSLGRKQVAGFTLGMCLSLSLLPALLRPKEQVIIEDATSAVLLGYRANLSAEVEGF